MNSRAPKRIAILHAKEDRHQSARYLIHVIAEIWREKGAEVVDLYGTEGHAEADLLVVHVDRSVVKPEYLEFAAGYPRVLNLGVADIRKRGYCPWLVRPGDGYEGPVLVKSNLNYAGGPERRDRSTGRRVADRLWRACASCLPRLMPPAEITRKDQYRIYPSPLEVPPPVFADERAVVQRFLPEMSGGDYVLRECYFLGGAHWMRAEVSEHPVITHGTYTPALADREVPPEVAALRARMGLDYGKIDYVMREGRAVIFDCNKTVGIHSLAHARDTAEMLAWGICPDWRGAA
jgi:hypothetical protein